MCMYVYTCVDRLGVALSSSVPGPWPSAAPPPLVRSSRKAVTNALALICASPGRLPFVGTVCHNAQDWNGRKVNVLPRVIVTTCLRRFVDG